MKTVAASVFDQGADCIYMEARDITVAIVKKLGGRVTGEPVLFLRGEADAGGAGEGEV